MLEVCKADGIKGGQRLNHIWISAERSPSEKVIMLVYRAPKMGGEKIKVQLEGPSLGCKRQTLTVTRGKKRKKNSLWF